MTLLEFIWGKIRPRPGPMTKPDFEHQRQRFAAWEAEGASAGLADKTRADCPYPAATSSWHAWVYGRDTAVGEKAIIASGQVIFATTSFDGPSWSVPVEDAVRTGQWKPRWAGLPSSSPPSTIGKSTS